MKLADVAVDESDAIDGFQVFAQALPCIVWIADANGIVKWYNDDFHRYTGLTPRTAAIRGWIHCVHPDDQPSITRALTQCFATGSQLDSIVRLKDVEGVYRWFSARARPFRGADGSISNWLGTLTNIHDRQLLLEANTHVVDALMKGYLSKPFPTASGITFDTHYRAANVLERLGGDWYDVFELPDRRVGFSLGDVCGHGVGAAVKMGEAKQAIFVAACLGDPDPLRVLHEANDVLFLNNHNVSITTAIYGIVDSAQRTVIYASAGHHPPILARGNGQTVILPNHGFPLGVEEHMPARIEAHGFAYESGSTMVLYTDGIIEFGHDMVKGETRLLAAAAEAVRCRATHPAKFIAEHTLGDAQADDDIAVLTLSFHAGRGVRRSSRAPRTHP